MKLIRPKPAAAGWLVATLAAVGLVCATAAQPPSDAASQLASAPSLKHSVQVMDFGSLAASVSLAFSPTNLASGAAGEGAVKLDRGVARLHATFTGLSPAARAGREFLTYVVWSVTAQGRTTNLGEFTIQGDKGEFDAKIEWRRFGLLVTAEPYFAVSQPSTAVMFEAVPASGAPGAVPTSIATCALAPPPVGLEAASAHSESSPDPGEPLVIEEARRAVAAARAAGAEQFAPLTFDTATRLLELAEDQHTRGVKLKDVLDTGSEATLIAEDARVLAAARQKHAGQSDPPPPAPAPSP